MELRSVLKLAIGMAVGATALASVANAAPMAPASSGQLVAPQMQGVEPALVSQSDVDHLKPTQVRWGHHWRGRHWGWHRHHWHRRHWR